MRERLYEGVDEALDHYEASFGKNGSLKSDDRHLIIVSACDVKAQQVTWFEDNRIPYGGITLFDGPGDIGKTTTLMGVIASASIGRSFFDGTNCDPVESLVVVEEDSLGVLKMRLNVAGADLSKVHFITGVHLADNNESFALPRHISELEAEIHDLGARFVYIDALFSHLELDGEGRMPQQVRRALRPIVEMVGRCEIAFAATRHWTKANGPASVRALGSVELGNVARSIITFGRHPEAEDRYAIVVTKHNLAPSTPALTYRIEVVTTIDDVGKETQTTRIELEGEAPEVTADDLAMGQLGDPDERNAAQDWLTDYLADGEWHPSTEIYRAARKDHAGSGATMRRAARRLGVERDRSGFPSRSRWRLQPVRSQFAHSQSVSNLEQTGEQTATDARGDADLVTW